MGCKFEHLGFNPLLQILTLKHPGCLVAWLSEHHLKNPEGNHTDMLDLDKTPNCDLTKSYLESDDCAALRFT